MRNDQNSCVSGMSDEHDAPGSIEELTPGVMPVKRHVLAGFEDEV